MQSQHLSMPSHWPIAYTVALATNSFMLACCIHSCSTCRCLRVGPLHMQLQKLLMPSHWPTACTVAVPVNAFALAYCICSCSCCRFLCIGPLHTQPQQPLMPSCWVVAYAASVAANAFMLALEQAEQGVFNAIPDISNTDFVYLLNFTA
jgi:hypothetical protein